MPSPNDKKAIEEFYKYLEGMNPGSSVLRKADDEKRKKKLKKGKKDYRNLLGK